MEKALWSAANKNQKHLKKAGMANIITAAVRGEAGGQSSTLSAHVTANAIEDIRKHFSSTTIQHMLRSVDYAGHQISGLKPFIEHILKIQLYPYKMELQKSLLRSSSEVGCAKLQSCIVGAQWIFQTSSHILESLIITSIQAFYLDLQRVLVLPSLNPERIWTPPTTKSSGRKDCLIKLTALSISPPIIWRRTTDHCWRLTN